MKTSFRIVVFVLLGILMICPIAYAEDATITRTLEAVDKTNIIIGNTITNTVVVADTLVSNNVNPDVIIASLINRTNIMTAVMIKRAARNSVTVVCEYVEVEIGGNTVLVDPCRVINY